jgi:hypothetical protein
MTNEELIGLAVKADLCDEYGTVNYEYGYLDEILAFGKLVAKAERNRLINELKKMPMNDTASSLAIWIGEQQ